MIVVDIGCGSGNVTKMLCGTLTPKKILASDFDAQMVEYAKEKCGDERIEYFVQDISLPWDQLDEKLKNLEGKVDLVWSNRVLHWVSDKATAAKTIARLLKPGGRCYINITLFRDVLEFEEAEEKSELVKCFNFPSHKEQSDNWDSYFKNSGLSQVNIQFIEKKWMFDNNEQKAQMFSSVYPYLTGRSTNDFLALPEAEKKIRIDRMVNISTKYTRTPHGKNPLNDADENDLSMYYEQFRVIGRK